MLGYFTITVCCITFARVLQLINEINEMFF